MFLMQHNLNTKFNIHYGVYFKKYYLSTHIPQYIYWNLVNALVNYNDASKKIICAGKYCEKIIMPIIPVA